jgi:hypothetical protein
MFVRHCLSVSSMLCKGIIVKQTTQTGQYLYFNIKSKALIYLLHYQVCLLIYYPICPYIISVRLLKIFYWCIFHCAHI